MELDGSILLRLTHGCDVTKDAYSTNDRKEDLQKPSTNCLKMLCAHIADY